MGEKTPQQIADDISDVLTDIGKLKVVTPTGLMSLAHAAGTDIAYIRQSVQRLVDAATRKAEAAS